jgi:pimeloyl-ACP methyl ester carboxylesterase
MVTRTLQVEGLQVTYHESAGRGPGAILIHGNSSSGMTFRHQLEGELGTRYRLVALDLPGHGHSQRAADLAGYSLPAYAKVVAGIAEQLEMEDAALVGWSLGGHIALETHDRLPEARGFVIYGAPPLAFPPAMDQAFLPNPVLNVGFTAEVGEDEANTYARSFVVPGSEADLQPFVSDILRTDGNARVGLASSIKPDGYQDEVQVVANLTRPLAVLHGEQEQLVNVNYIRELAMPSLWRGEIQVIPGAGHAPHWEQPAAFNALLDDFLSDA